MKFHKIPESSTENVAVADPTRIVAITLEYDFPRRVDLYNYNNILDAGIINEHNNLLFKQLYACTYWLLVL